MTSTALVVTVLALLGNRPILELKLESSKPSVCALKRSKDTIALSKQECNEARKLMEETYQWVSSPAFKGRAKAKAPIPTPDEPTYQMIVSGKTFFVPFEAPEECELLPSGQQRCKKNALDSAQKLLLFIRARKGR